MQRTINGKKIKITASGYLYINGIKQSDRGVSPLCTPTDDADAIAVCNEYSRKNWKMVNN